MDDYRLLIDLHKQGHRQGPGGDAETEAKIFSGGMHEEVTGGRPQIELAAGGVALEAAIPIGYQIDPELAALTAT